MVPKRLRPRNQRLRLAIFFAAVYATTCWAEPPIVVATISPIHSLLSLVTEGISRPSLLLETNKSPHTYQMRPSDAAAIRNASVIYRVSPDLEVFLNKSLANLGAGVRVIDIINIPGLQRYPARPHGPHDEEQTSQGDHDHQEHTEPERTRLDAHVWLDPRNAQIIVRSMAAHLAQLDPAHRSTYEANATRAVARLQDLDERASLTLQPVRNRPFVVFHDAYQYLERRYQLTSLGAVSNLAVGASSARRLEHLQQEIRRLQVRCLFVEPQFDSHKASKLTSMPTVKTHTLDPIGAGIVPGPDAYITMMEKNIRSLTSCLQDAPD